MQKLQSSPRPYDPSCKESQTTSLFLKAGSNVTTVVLLRPASLSNVQVSLHRRGSLEALGSFLNSLFEHPTRSLTKNKNMFWVVSKIKKDTVYKVPNSGLGPQQTLTEQESYCSCFQHCTFTVSKVKDLLVSDTDQSMIKISPEIFR